MEARAPTGIEHPRDVDRSHLNECGRGRVREQLLMRGRRDHWADSTAPLPGRPANACAPRRATRCRARARGNSAHWWKSLMRSREVALARVVGNRAAAGTWGPAGAWGAAPTGVIVIVLAALVDTTRAARCRRPGDGVVDEDGCDGGGGGEGFGVEDSAAGRGAVQEQRQLLAEL